MRITTILCLLNNIFLPDSTFIHILTISLGAKLESPMAATPERPEGVEASSVSADERIRRAFVAVDARVARRRQSEAVVADALKAAGDVRASPVLAD